MSTGMKHVTVLFLSVVFRIFWYYTSIHAFSMLLRFGFLWCIHF